MTPSRSEVMAEAQRRDLEFRHRESTKLLNPQSHRVGMEGEGAAAARPQTKRAPAPPPQANRPPVEATPSDILPGPSETRLLPPRKRKVAWPTFLYCLSKILLPSPR